MGNSEKREREKDRENYSLIKKSSADFLHCLSVAVAAVIIFYRTKAVNLWKLLL